MIITSIKGGLGNQLFQYACGRAAAASHNVPLKLDISAFPDHNGRVFQLKHFNIRAKLANRLELNLFRYFIAKLPINAQKGIFSYTYLKEKEPCRYDPGIFQCHSNAYLSGYWQCYYYANVVRNILINEFKVLCPPDEQNETFLNKISNQDSENAVAVHVRRGDYVTNATINSHLGVCPLEYYQNAIAYFSSILRGPCFYVFSDDPEWAKKHLKQNGDRLTIIDHNQSTDGNIQDFRLMCACTHFIISNSTFSWWAAWLGQAKNKQVVTPKRWFAAKNRNDIELIPPEWKRL